MFEEKVGGSKKIVVVTHLYWNPKLEHVKYAQASMLINEVSEFKKMFEYPVVIVGDINSIPYSSVLNLFYGENPMIQRLKMKFQA